MSTSAGLSQVGGDASNASLFIDYDGVLAPIVADPASATPSARAVDALNELIGRGVAVTVVSGRPVSFLQGMLADVGVHVVGLYGLESAAPDGVVVEHEKAGSWRRVVDEVVDRARTDGPAGMGVEHKGLSLTLHYRSDPGLERDVVAWARDEGERTQLSVRAAKQSVELHPPVDIDKGTALLEHLRRDDGPVVYVGDDLGDLPAFDALDRLASEGRRVLRVAVAGDEAPHELLDRGDVVVAGTGEVPEFLLS